MTLPNAHRNSSMRAAELRAAALAIDERLTMDRLATVVAGLALAGHVLLAWQAADQPTRNLIRRYAPELGAALDDLERGPER